MEIGKSNYETIVVEEKDNERQFIMNSELIRCHYNDLAYAKFIEFMGDECASVGLNPDFYDVVDMMNELGIFEKCPKCNEMSEGTTYLYHQCKNGHMWEETPI